MTKKLRILLALSQQNIFLTFRIINLANYKIIFLNNRLI